MNKVLNIMKKSEAYAHESIKVHKNFRNDSDTRHGLINSSPAHFHETHMFMCLRCTGTTNIVRIILINAFKPESI